MAVHIIIIYYHHHHHHHGSAHYRVQTFSSLRKAQQTLLTYTIKKHKNGLEKNKSLILNTKLGSQASITQVSETV